MNNDRYKSVELNKIILDKKPFPWKDMSVLAVVSLNEGLCSNMLIPFIGLYVAKLMETTPEKAGFTSGFLISMFMLGQMISSPQWGKLSDTYGRKPSLLFGLLSSTIIMILFGLSPNIYFCIVIRLLHGFSNGNILIVKAMVPEIVDKSNEAKGYALPSITWGCGMLLGPFIGGALYDPSRFEWLGLSKEGLFGHYPALLPSIIIALYSFFASAVCYFFLQETNNNCRPLPFTRAAREAKIENKPSPQSAPAKKSKFGFKQAFARVISRNSLIMYMCVSFTDIAFYEIIPLWAVARRSYGGLEMPTETIGLIVLLNAFSNIASNLSFSHAIKKLGGPVNVHRFGVSVWLIFQCSVPFCNLLEGWFCVIALLLMMFIRQFGSSISFSSSFFVIGRAAPAGHLGSMNGIGQSAGCLSRTVAPVIFAPIFAWSIAYVHPFPFNHHFGFWLSSTPLLLCFWACRNIANDPAIAGMPAVESAASVTEVRVDSGDDMAAPPLEMMTEDQHLDAGEEKLPQPAEVNDRNNE